MFHIFLLHIRLRLLDLLHARCFSEQGFTPQTRLMAISIFLACFLGWCTWCLMDFLSYLFWYLDFQSSISKEIIYFILHGYGLLLAGFCVCLIPSLKQLYGLVLYTTQLVLLLLQGGNFIVQCTCVEQVLLLVYCWLLISLCLMFQVFPIHVFTLFNTPNGSGSLQDDGFCCTGYDNCQYIWICCAASYIFVGWIYHSKRQVNLIIFYIVFNLRLYNDLVFSFFRID